MFRSLRNRLLLTYLFVTGLVLTLVAVSLLAFLASSPIIRNLSYARLERVLSDLLPETEQILPISDAGKLQVKLRELDATHNMRFLVLADRSEIVADSRPQSGVESIEVFSQVWVGGGVKRGEFRDQLGKMWFWIGESSDHNRAIILASRRPGLLTLIGSALRPGPNPQLEYAGGLFLPILRAAGIGFLLSLLLAWLVSRWIASPLQRVSVAAMAVAKGDYRQSVKPEGPREVEDVAYSFNAMVQQVQTSQQIQRDFLANVSHELKTPLTSIQGFAQAMLDGAAADDEARGRAAQVIYDESDRLRRLVGDLLDLARIDAGQISFERTPVYLKILLSGIIEKLNLRAREKGVGLENRLPDLPIIIGDGDRLAQVFTNLVDNAIKHTPDGGIVRLQGNIDAGWVSIHVDDTGPGIPTEDLSRIFERFYQVDKARRGGEGRGVGLGLAISSQIVEAHKGRIVAQSTLGKGSRFTVQLPIVRPEDKTLVSHFKGQEGI